MNSHRSVSRCGTSGRTAPSSRFSSSARAFGDVVLTADRSAFGEGVLCCRAQWQVGGNPLVVREHPEAEFGVNEVAEVLEEEQAAALADREG